MVQRVKDVALPQLWCRSYLQLGFDPWPRNAHMPRGWLIKWGGRVVRILNKSTQHNLCQHLLAPTCPERKGRWRLLTGALFPPCEQQSHSRDPGRQRGSQSCLFCAS